MTVTGVPEADQETRPVSRLRDGFWSTPPARAAIVLGALILALLLAYFRSGSPVIVVQAVFTGLLLGGVYGLVAMGLTLIFGVLDIVNFAHGALMTLGMYITYVLVQSAGMNLYLTLLVSVPALFLVGLLIHKMALSKTAGLENQLLLTLGLALLIENALLVGFTATPKNLAVSYDATLRAFGGVAQLSRVIAFLGALAIAAALYVLLQRTRLGTSIRSVAANPLGAQLVGIDVRRVKLFTFALGTACAGAAGTLVVPFTSVSPTTGELFNILAYIVVVLGGLGKVTGALVGGLLIGLTEQLGGIYFPGQSPLLTVFVVFVLVLFLRPQGLFGRRA